MVTAPSPRRPEARRLAVLHARSPRSARRARPRRHHHPAAALLLGPGGLAHVLRPVMDAHPFHPQLVHQPQCGRVLCFGQPKIWLHVRR